jgi:hypothetical protein
LAPVDGNEQTGSGWRGRPAVPAPQRIHKVRGPQAVTRDGAGGAEVFAAASCKNFPRRLARPVALIRRTLPNYMKYMEKENETELGMIPAGRRPTRPARRNSRFGRSRQAVGFEGFCPLWLLE